MTVISKLILWVAFKFLWFVCVYFVGSWLLTGYTDSGSLQAWYGVGLVVLLWAVLLDASNTSRTWARALDETKAERAASDASED